MRPNPTRGVHTHPSPTRAKWGALMTCWSSCPHHRRIKDESQLSPTFQSVVIMMPPPEVSTVKSIAKRSSVSDISPSNLLLNQNHVDARQEGPRRLKRGGQIPPDQ